MENNLDEYIRDFEKKVEFDNNNRLQLLRSEISPALDIDINFTRAVWSASKTYIPFHVAFFNNAVCVVRLEVFKRNRNNKTLFINQAYNNENWHFSMVYNEARSGPTWSASHFLFYLFCFIVFQLTRDAQPQISHFHVVQR